MSGTSSPLLARPNGTGVVSYSVGPTLSLWRPFLSLAVSEFKVKRYVDAGNALMEKGHFATAARVYEKAYSLFPHPAFRLRVARAHAAAYSGLHRLRQKKGVSEVSREELYHLQRAVDAYSEYSTIVPRSRSTIEKEMGPLSDKLTSLGSNDTVVLEQPTELVVVTDPPDAEIYIGTEQTAAGRSPVVRRSLPLGRYKIRAQREGYEPRTRTVELIDLLVLQVDLTPPRALLALWVLPDGATVYLDQKRVGTSPLNPFYVPPGEHRVKVTAEGYEPWKGLVDLKPGASEILIELSRAGARWRVAEESLRVALLGLGMGTTFLVAHHTGDEPDDVAIRRGEGLRYAGFISLGISIVATAVAGASWFSQYPEEGDDN